MDKDKIIYQLSVKDILTVIEDNELKIKINESDTHLLEDRIGNFIDWRGAIEFALMELGNSRKKQ
ncbi:MAG: hypothetical protein FD151_1295 [bacterium]|nr:MAG: hypothetical protein FD151_1295 [bacterium]